MVAGLLSQRPRASQQGYKTDAPYIQNEVCNKKNWLVISVGYSGTGYPGSGRECPVTEESISDWTITGDAASELHGEWSN